MRLTKDSRTVPCSEGGEGGEGRRREAPATDASQPKRRTRRCHGPTAFERISPHARAIRRMIGSTSSSAARDARRREPGVRPRRARRDGAGGAREAVSAHPERSRCTLARCSARSGIAGRDALAPNDAACATSRFGCFVRRRLADGHVRERPARDRRRSRRTTATRVVTLENARRDRPARRAGRRSCAHGPRWRSSSEARRRVLA